MPLYDFTCNDCDFEFEENVKLNIDIDIECPHCHSKNVKKLISVCKGTNFILKGSGFYRTDYQKSYYKHPANKSVLKNKQN